MTSRNLLSIVVLGAVGVLLVGQVRQLLADPTVWPPDDFVEYWAAAKLTLHGQNPFDEALLLPLQRHAGRNTDDAIMMWNPPWALPAVLPLGVLPAREAQLLWLLVHFVVAGFCADRLWLLLGGARRLRWVSWAVAFTFMPTVFALSSGQISPFLLLGAVLFLECERRIATDRRWEYLAGAATVLVAIKPHLAYLLWTGIAVDAVVRGRWRVVVGGAVAGLVCAALPLALNPQVWHQYADAMGNRPPAQWLSPTLGTVLRMLFGPEHFRLQFVSVALGVVWFAWYRAGTRGDWNWQAQLPLVLLVSFCTAPYGAWPFDMVLLLPAVVAMLVKNLPPSPLLRRGEGPSVPSPLAGEGGGASPPGEGALSAAVPRSSPELDRVPLTRLEDSPPSPTRGEGQDNSPCSEDGVGRGSSSVLAGLLAVNLGCLVMNLLQLGSFWFLWVSPTVLLLYTLQTRRAPVARASHPRAIAPVPA